VRVLIEIGHPGHVHLFRYVIKELQARGHLVKVVSRDKDVTLQLLERLSIEHVCISRKQSGIISLVMEMFMRDWRLLRISTDFRPDIYLSVSMCSTHIALLTGKISVIFTDSEHAKLEKFGWKYTASVICTSTAYQENLGRKHIRYRGYHELAYLHPRRFKPDSGVLDEIGLSANEPFFILRFVSWQASHDIGQKGFSAEGKRELVRILERHGRVLISTESELPDEFSQYLIRIPPDRMHDLLAYSSLYIGEGATMASEAAMLGVPAIYVNTLTAGTLKEQQNDYHLLRWIPEEENAITMAERIASDPEALRRHKDYRRIMLVDKVDVTGWIVKLSERLVRKTGKKHEQVA